MFATSRLVIDEERIIETGAAACKVSFLEFMIYDKDIGHARSIIKKSAE